jgi:hypothetical protein
MVSFGVYCSTEFEFTFQNHPANISPYRLLAPSSNPCSTTPLFATLTNGAHRNSLVCHSYENAGVYSRTFSRPDTENVHPRSTSPLLAALTHTVALNSFAYHSYEKCRVYLFRLHLFNDRVSKAPPQLLHSTSQSSPSPHNSTAATVFYSRDTFTLRNLAPRTLSLFVGQENIAHA